MLILVYCLLFQMFFPYWKFYKTTSVKLGRCWYTQYVEIAPSLHCNKPWQIVYLEYLKLYADAS